MPRKATVAEELPTSLRQELNQEIDGWTKRELDHYHQIQTANQDVAAANKEYLVSKEETAALKKAYEGKAETLQWLISAGPNAQLTLPGMNEDTEAWRSVPLEDAIRLTAKQIEKFADSGVGTMGELEDLRANEGLLAVEGIGEKAADGIEEAMLDWLAQNRQAEPEPTGGETEKED